MRPCSLTIYFKKFGCFDFKKSKRRFTSGVPTHHATEFTADCSVANVHARRSLPVQRINLVSLVLAVACGHSRSEITKTSRPGDGTGIHACLRHRILGVRISPGAPIRTARQQVWPMGFQPMERGSIPLRFTNIHSRSDGDRYQSPSRKPAAKIGRHRNPSPELFRLINSAARVSPCLGESRRFDSGMRRHFQSQHSSIGRALR